MLSYALLWLVACLWTNICWADADWQHDFDAAKVALEVRPGTAPVQILRHEANSGQHRFGKSAEYISLRCPGGHSAPLAVAIPPTPVIEEFGAECWLKCNRPGAQLCAQVVLPRSTNPQTGKPHTFVLRGSDPGLGGNWEKLVFSGLPKALDNMARVARLQANYNIDARQAYISHLVLLVPGGAGASEVLVDRISVSGLANLEGTSSAGPATPSGNDLAKAQLKRPRIPRIINWQGESFEFLSKLGFHAIGMQRLPTDTELAEAERLGMWIVCPPPAAHDIATQGIPDKYRNVLAWNFGPQLSQNDIQQVTIWQDLIKRKDLEAERSTVLAPQLLTREASRIADIVQLNRESLGAGLTLREYSTWLSQRTRLARPGTPTWLQVPTQISAQHELQLQAIGTPGSELAALSYAQLTSLLAAGAGIKADGFYFDSRRSLESKTSTPLLRAQALELVNLRLELMEPWLSIGKLLTSARSNNSNLSALVLQAERSQLLVPISWSKSLDDSGQAGPQWTSFVVPGVAESSEAYLLTLGGPQRLRHKRVAGGIQIEIEQLPSDGLILLTEDPSAFSQVARHLRQHAPRATELRRNLVHSRLQMASALTPVSIGDALSEEELQAWTQMASRAIETAEAAAKGRNFELAYRNLSAADDVLNQMETLVHQKVAGSRSERGTSLLQNFVSLPNLLRMDQQIRLGSHGQNLIPEGGFEQLDTLLGLGWRHQRLSLPEVSTAVRLSPRAPHSGQYCLEMEAQPLSSKSAAVPVLPTAPVWIKSRPITILKGQIVEITGQARVPIQLMGTVDGLQVFDSLGGNDLGMRIKASSTWQPFRMIRTATSDTDFDVTIALSGLGTAQVDDLAVRVLSSNDVSRVSAVAGTHPESR